MEERKREKMMEQSLYKAAVQGETAKLEEILRQDSMILQRVMVGCFAHTPLHVAASKGHWQFANKLVSNEKALAGVLDQRRWSALHLAAANGYDGIVKVLVEANANMCLTPDDDGRNPLHLAAIEGRDSVLKVFFDENPRWIHHELLKAIDGGGNTVLHLAIRNKKFKTMYSLLAKIKEQVKDNNIQETENPLNIINKCGCSALDILEKFKSSEVEDIKKIKKKLQKFGALKAATLRVDQALSKRQNVLMVVASLMATMAFQAGVAPPGGVWQDNVPNNKTQSGPNNETQSGHYAGESVIAHRNDYTYYSFFVSNTVGFLASLSTILFLMTGLPFKKKLFTRILVLIMCLAVTSMGFTYAYSFIAITPTKDPETGDGISFGIMVWCGVICVLMVIHTIPLLNRLLKVSWDRIWPPMKKFMEFMWGKAQPQRMKLMKFIPPLSNQCLPTSSNGNNSNS